MLLSVVIIRWMCSWSEQKRDMCFRPITREITMIQTNGYLSFVPLLISAVVTKIIMKWLHEEPKSWESISSIIYNKCEEKHKKK